MYVIQMNGSHFLILRKWATEQEWNTVNECKVYELKSWIDRITIRCIYNTNLSQTDLI